MDIDFGVVQNFHCSGARPFGFMRVFFVISQSKRFIVNLEDDALDILNVMGPSVSNYFF